MKGIANFKISAALFLKYIRMLSPYSTSSYSRKRIIALRNYNGRVFLVGQNYPDILRIDITNEIDGVVEDMLLDVVDTTTVIRSLQHVSDEIRIKSLKDSLFVQFFANTAFVEVKVIVEEEYFEVPNIGNELFIFTPDQIEAIKNVGAVACRDDARPVLNGILVDQNSFVSTDGFRLGVQKIPEEENSNNISESIGIGKILPLSILNMLSSKFPVSVSKDGDSYWLSSNNLSFRFQLVDGKFPDYNAILRVAFNLNVVFDKMKLTRVLESTLGLGKFSKTSPCIHIVFEEKDNATITISSEKFASFAIPYSIISSNNNIKLPFTIAFSPELTLGCLRKIKDESVIFRFGVHNSPFQIEPYVNKNIDLKYLVMPMHL